LERCMFLKGSVWAQKMSKQWAHKELK
jgi:hypothetical protein